MRSCFLPTKLEDILLTVQRPGRYTGGEWNAVKKEWDDGKVKVLLAFPDAYEVGMSHLGLKILYGILNRRNDCLCERAFAPWPDFEKALRENGIELFSLESRAPIREFDIVGLSLAYELTYTNAVNILDLGNIPVRSADRTDDDPLVIAGGPCCCNPEPMAEFIDAFVIGDAEDAIEELIDMYKGIGPRGPGSRKKILKGIAEIEGVYVPSFYRVEYNQDRSIKKFSSVESGAPQVIRKRAVKNLDDAFYPTEQIVPNVRIVHDRIAIEIMRGCKHGCRFCQASAVYRPWRERSRKKILELARQSYRSTGYDEISLLSLSSVDHSGIVDIINDLNEEFGPKSVSISVPSLRIEENIEYLPALISKVRKSGLTFAPEAGSLRLRNIIGKDIDIEKLFKAAAESYKAGWKRVKLYFMIGLPGEEDADIADIAKMLYALSDLKRDVDGRQARISASVNAYIPKPHTIFQWEAMAGDEKLEVRRNLLKRNIKSRLIEMDFHPFRACRLECALSRGDRTLSRVIYESWKAGARFDGWKEMLDMGIWSRSFEKAGTEMAFYTDRQMGFDETLPWDFIDMGIKKEFLLKEAARLRAR